MTFKWWNGLLLAWLAVFLGCHYPIHVCNSSICETDRKERCFASFAYDVPMFHFFLGFISTTFQLASTTSWVAIDAVTFRGVGGRAGTFQLASTTSWVAIDAVNIFEQRLNAFFWVFSSLDIASLDIASLDSASLDSANLDILESGHFAHSTFRTFYLLSGHSTFLHRNAWFVKPVSFSNLQYFEKQGLRPCFCTVL